MYTRCRSLVLHWLKVPPEPHPPAGAPASLRVFRAGKNYLNLRLVTWAIPQIFALAGIIFWTVVLIDIETAVRTRQPAPSASTITEPAPTSTPALASPGGKSVRRKVRINGWAEFKQMLVAVAAHLPWWSFPLLWLFKIGGIALYLVQIPLTFAIRRLDYEMRWYVVTDRSLRIRTGVWNVQELTMSFANLQQVEVSQGPLQGLLGLADVRVQSAGGGSSENHAHGQRDSLHTAMFHSVENATEIRDLILERLRLFRATGLGDPDEPHAPVSVPRPNAAPVTTTADTLAAAHELLAEARELRRTLAS